LFHPDKGLEVQSVWYIQTKKEDKKRGIRAKSDDLRRVEEICLEVDEIFRHHPADVFSFEECPSIHQNATTTRKCAMGWGTVFGLACRTGAVMLEYSPTTLKKVVTNQKTASKALMIETLEARHPVLKAYKLAATKREHIADAVAAAETAAADQIVIGLARAYGRALNA
jgi:Holliday junction resolvasome RuvABC endonuclease subunit